jgi:T-complex protein 1 subunit delta
MDYANTLVGADAYCFKAFAEAMEVIPYTLAENAGLNPIATVTELRNRHAQVIQKIFVVFMSLEFVM